MSPAFEMLTSWSNLIRAWQRAAKGKRARPTVAALEWRLADELIVLQRSLRDQSYRPGGYRDFFIHEPKRRRISAAAFRDRVVHHALCQVIEPRFERVFIPDSYANRVGKGTHRAVDKVQVFARRHRYALRMDIVQHFAAIDHAALQAIVWRYVSEAELRELISKIIASGDGVLASEYRMVWFPGDDLLAACRPRGLPIGNLTSQFWSNCYLHGLDVFVKRELGFTDYVRYVDDFVLFGESKRQLYEAKQAIIERLSRLRLTVHASRGQVVPCTAGIPWLGFVVYPTYRRVKARKVRHTTRRLRARYHAWCKGQLSFAELDASVQGWINHVRYADSEGLRDYILSEFELGHARVERSGGIPMRT